MNGALNPKVSLLVKLAQIAHSGAMAETETDSSAIRLYKEPFLDAEVVAWLDRMAELKYIRQPISETKDTLEKE